MTDGRFPFKAAIEAFNEQEGREKAEAEKRAKEKASAEAQAKAQRQQIIAQFGGPGALGVPAGFTPGLVSQFPQRQVYLPIPTPSSHTTGTIPKKEEQEKDDEMDETDDGEEFKEKKSTPSKKGKKGKRGKKNSLLSAIPRDKVLFKRLNVLVHVTKSPSPSNPSILGIDDNVLHFFGKFFILYFEARH
jgi:hypothetical protein